jgi:hypothetical protein
LKKRSALAGIIGIFRKRWPEVILVVAFQAGLMVLLEEVSSKTLMSGESGGAALPGHIAFILGVGTAVFAVVWQMLYLGFLATAYSEGARPKEPGELLRVGRYYFWRMLRFQVVLGIVYVGISFVFLATVYSIVFEAKNPLEIPVWVANLCSFAALAVLVKPFLLCPAVMIVTDRMALEAFALLKAYRILKAKGLLALFFVCFGVIFLISSLLSSAGRDGPYYYILVAGYGIISSTLILAVTLGAVLFVAQRANLAIEDTEESNGDEFTE